MKIKFHCPCCDEELIANVKNNEIEIMIADSPPKIEVSQILEKHNIIFGS